MTQRNFPIRILHNGEQVYKVHLFIFGIFVNCEYNDRLQRTKFLWHAIKKFFHFLVTLCHHFLICSPHNHLFYCHVKTMQSSTSFFYKLFISLIFHTYKKELQFKCIGRIKNLDWGHYSVFWLNSNNMK